LQKIRNSATFWSRDISLVMATGYGLDGWGSIPGTGKRYSILHSVQTGSVAHPASYPMGIGGGLISKECQADHSPKSTAEVKNGWRYTCTPPYAFMAWSLIS
jgi:hypothetical protein